MAWERKFEQRVIKVRGKELKYLKFTCLTQVNSLINLFQPSLKHHFTPADLIDRRLVCLCWIPEISSQHSFLQFQERYTYPCYSHLVLALHHNSPPNINSFNCLYLGWLLSPIVCQSSNYLIIH